jgi:hypothetical protein
MYEIVSYCRTNVLRTALLLESLTAARSRVERLVVKGGIVRELGVTQGGDIDVVDVADVGAAAPQPGDRTRLRASRRSVFTRRPALRGMSAGAMTSQRTPRETS